MKKRSLFLLSSVAACVLLSACQDETAESISSTGTETAATLSPDEPKYVFPEADAPDAFHRAYVMTESPDGNLRLFSRETRDDTDIFQTVRKKDGSWSEPEKLDWPKNRSNVNPFFSPWDGKLYFASDRPVQGFENRREMNLYSIERTEDGEWGEAFYLPGDVNTGADETNVTMSPDGTMYFVSKHPRGQGGQDIYVARYDSELEEWKFEALPENVSSPRVESHVTVTPDGQNLIFYSYLQPKLGVVDLKVVTRQEDGSWIGPYSLGPKINTRGIDFGTGLSHDGKTFFFSREGKMMEMPVSALMKEIETARQAYLDGRELSHLGLPEE